jgi:hypothetical protein
MQQSWNRNEPIPRRQPQQSGPLRTGAAMILLSLGMTIAWVGQLCLRLGQQWAGERTLRAWRGLLDHFHSAPPQPAQPRWERHLLRIGPSVLLAIGGALLILWTLLGLGGALFWLASHGWGAWLLAVTIALGTIVGSWIALVRPATRRDRLN